MQRLRHALQKLIERTTTMNSIAQDYPAVLSGSHESPCVSLYQPTHRRHPDNAQDPIRFRNLVKTMGESLRQKYPKREIKPLMHLFHGHGGHGGHATSPTKPANKEE